MIGCFVLKTAKKTLKTPPNHTPKPPQPVDHCSAPPSDTVLGGRGGQWTKGLRQEVDDRQLHLFREVSHVKAKSGVMKMGHAIAVATSDN